MNCELAIEQISEFLDDRLTNEQKEQLQVHMESCSQCRQILQDLQQAQQGLLQMQVEPPKSLVPDIMQKIYREQARTRARRRLKWTAAVCAGAAAVLVVLTGMGVLKTPDLDLTEGVSVSIGAAVENLCFQEDSDAEQFPSAYAAEIAAAHQCGVLVIGNCAELPELEDTEFEALEDGAKLYLVDSAVMLQLQQSYCNQFPMELIYPEESWQTEDSAPAYVMILP